MFVPSIASSFPVFNSAGSTHQLSTLACFALSVISNLAVARADRVDDYVRCMKECVEKARYPMVTCDALCGQALRVAKLGQTLTQSEIAKLLLQRIRQS